MINDEERNATRDSLHSYPGASDQFLKKLLYLVTAPAVAYPLTLGLSVFQLITPHQTTFEAIV